MAKRQGVPPTRAGSLFSFQGFFTFKAKSGFEGKNIKFFILRPKNGGVRRGVNSFIPF